MIPLVRLQLIDWNIITNIRQWPIVGRTVEGHRDGRFLQGQRQGRGFHGGAGHGQRVGHDSHRGINRRGGHSDPHIDGKFGGGKPGGTDVRTDKLICFEVSFVLAFQERGGGFGKEEEREEDK